MGKSHNLFTRQFGKAFIASVTWKRMACWSSALLSIVLLVLFGKLEAACHTLSVSSIFPSAFAAGHSERGNGGASGGFGNGNSNGNAYGVGGNNGASGNNGGGVNGAGAGNGGVDPGPRGGGPASGETPPPFSYEKQQREKEEANEKWVDDKPIDFSGLNVSPADYSKHLNLDLNLSAPGRSVGNQGDVIKHDDKLHLHKDHEPQGKAIGWRRKEELQDAAQKAAEDSSQQSQRSKEKVGAVKPGSYSRREVIAIDLHPSAIVRARALGFQISASGGRLSDGMLTVLIAPTNLDALDALALLQAELPHERFLLNRLYRFYRTAGADSAVGNQANGVAQPAARPGELQPARPRPARKCADDHCYGRAAIRWTESLAACARGIRVGVMDTDFDFLHPALTGQSIIHQSFLPDGRRRSANWHGTGVLALLAGHADSGTPGLIPEAQFFAGSIFFADDDGEAVTDTVSILKALDWMAASGVQLVNMSFAGPGDELVRERIRKMSGQGCVFTAAAGNEGPGAEPSYPAAYPEVVAVTAVDANRQVYVSANRGDYIDLAAPGVRIWTAAPNAQEGYRGGTSFATPFVTAVLALQRPEVLRAPKEELLRQVKTISLGSRERNATFGRGLLQAPDRCSGQAETVAYERPLGR